MYEAIILAAGQGKRMGANQNKQMIEIDHIPMIVHTLQVFERDGWCRRIILVGAHDELHTLEGFIQQYNIKKVDCIVPGGKERQDSVYEGLKHVIGDEAIVLIHDGARPFVTIDSLHRLYERAVERKAAILAVPVKDTIKKVEHEQVTETIERESLWAVQTPQAFQLSLIKKAHDKARKKQIIGTDDASFIEFIGESVSIVKGDYDNIKLTTKEDLYFAEAIIKKRRVQGGK